MNMTRRAKNNGPNSTVGQYRRETYEYCISQYNRAIDCGFYIEAVAIAESLIMDRLEARRAFLNPDDELKQGFSGFKTLKKHLGNDLNSIRDVIEEIRCWNEKRGEAIHQISKIKEGEFSHWKEKYGSIRKTAKDGFDLFRKIDKLVREHNKRPENKSTGEY